MGWQTKRPPGIRKMQITALVLLVLCGVINCLDRSVLAVAHVLIRQELGLNATSMGVLLSAFLLAYALSQIPVGFLIDRLGPRTLLGCAITLCSIAQAACGFIGSFTQFYFARIRLGIGDSAQLPPASDWARLFRFRTMWAAILATLDAQYPTWIYYTRLPGFLEIQQHMTISRTAPIVGTVGSAVGGFSTDWLSRWGFSPLTCRKVPLVSGLIGMAILAIATARSPNAHC